MLNELSIMSIHKNFKMKLYIRLYKLRNIFSCHQIQLRSIEWIANQNWTKNCLDACSSTHMYICFCGERLFEMWKKWLSKR